MRSRLQSRHNSLAFREWAVLNTRRENVVVRRKSVGTVHGSEKALASQYVAQSAMYTFLHHHLPCI